MLRSHRSNNADMGMHKITDLFDIAILFSTHLADKHFAIWLHHFTHSAYHTHSRIIAPRGHQCFEMLAEYAVQKMLCACFSITSCNSDDFQIGHRRKYRCRLIIIPSVDSVLHRHKHPDGNNNNYMRNAIKPHKGNRAIEHSG